MEASNVVSIQGQHSDALNKSRAHLKEQYRKQAQAAIMHALATRGRAVGPLGYDQPAATAAVEDMIFSESAVALHLIDLGQAFARGESMQNMGALAHRFFSAAVTFSANRLANAHDAEQVATEFQAGDANG